MCVCVWGGGGGGVVVLLCIHMYLCKQCFVCLGQPQVEVASLHCYTVKSFET